MSWTSPYSDPAVTQHLVDQTRLIDAECRQLVELAKRVQKHAVERTKNVREICCLIKRHLSSDYPIRCKLHTYLLHAHSYLQDLSTQITRVVAFAYQLSHLASIRLKSCTGWWTGLYNWTVNVIGIILYLQQMMSLWISLKLPRIW
jgi:hypothetical protein